MVPFLSRKSFIFNIVTNTPVSLSQKFTGLFKDIPTFFLFQFFLLFSSSKYSKFSLFTKKLETPNKKNNLKLYWLIHFLGLLPSLKDRRIKVQNLKFWQAFQTGHPVWGKKDDIYSFYNVQIFKRTPLKVANHNIRHFRPFFCSGGSRAARIASSNTFFKPFCNDKMYFHEIK